MFITSIEPRTKLFPKVKFSSYLPTRLLPTLFFFPQHVTGNKQFILLGLVLWSVLKLSWDIFDDCINYQTCKGVVQICGLTSAQRKLHLNCIFGFSFFSPEVQFCGYSIPHPTENKVNLRIQTNGELVLVNWSENNLYTITAKTPLCI